MTQKVKEDSQSVSPAKNLTSDRPKRVVGEMELFRQFVDSMQQKEHSDALRRKSKAENPLYRPDFDSTRQVSLIKMQRMKSEIESSVWN